MKIVGFVLFLIFAIGVPNLRAHITVQPTQVAAKAYQEFSVRVPTEKDEPTTSVKMVFPEGFEFLVVKPTAGWRYELERDATGRATSITWSGGRIASTEYEVFTFMARAANPGTFKLDAYQTYGANDVEEWVNTGEPGAAPQVRAVATDAADPAADPFSAPGTAPTGRPVAGSRAGMVFSGLSFVISLAALAIALRVRARAKS